MKLTRKQLIHAKDVQLHAVGLSRHKSKGWLKAALEREFTNREIAQFTFATRQTKRVGKFIISTDPDKQPPLELFHKKTDPNAAEIDRLKAELADEKRRLDWLDSQRQVFGPSQGAGKAQHWALMVSTDEPLTLRQAVDKVMARLPRVDVSELGPLIAALPNPHDNPETFANNLFEESGRDLA